MVSKKILVLLIIVVALVWYLKDRGILSFGKESRFKIPPEFKNSGQEGLRYFKRTYSSDLSQARGLCINFFKGQWVDSANELGCYNMEDFLEIYCGFGEANEIKYVCNEIGGSFTCSSKEIKCRV
jgi:hypothetical protein